MKKLQYSYMPAGSAASRIVKNEKSVQKSLKEKGQAPPSEEMITRLNAIAREYPFCVSSKHSNNSIL